MTHSSHRHSRSENPRRVRSAIMRHVAGFTALGAYLLFVWMRSSPEEGTSSNSTVVFYLITCGVVYGAAYWLYKPMSRAWKDSSR